MKRRSFDANGDYAINSFIEDSEATIQAVYTRLKLFKGEWFLNLNSGFPWFQEVLVKPANLKKIEKLVRDTILQTTGVKELLQFDLVFDRDLRKLTVSFKASTIYDDEFENIIGLNPVGI